MKYFSYDAHQQEFEYHNSAEEAKSYAHERVDFYVQNDHTDFINVHWGEIKESADDRSNSMQEVK